MASVVCTTRAPHSCCPTKELNEWPAVHAVGWDRVCSSCIFNKRRTQMNNGTSGSGLGETANFIKDAIMQAAETGDNGAPFTEQIVGCGLALRSHDLAAYQSTL